MNTEQLIHDLSSGLAPVKRLPSPGRRLATWLAVSVPVLAAITWFFGFRPDLAQCLADNRFVIQNLAALLTGLTAAWAALASSVPGFKSRQMMVPLVPALLWLASAGEGCWAEWRANGWSNLDSVVHQKCLPEIVGSGLVPALALMVLLRRGLSLTPGLTAALAALAAAATGSAALSLFHEGDTAWVTLTWHVGSATGLSAVASLAGPWLFKDRARSRPA